VLVCALLLGLYGMRSLGGFDSGFDLWSLSAEQSRSLVNVTGHVLSVIALLFGLAFTRFGRRVRSMLR
jgi:hypothetical protein